MKKEDYAAAEVHTAFKSCPSCGSQWPTRDAFLADPHLTLIGYQVSFKQLTAGILLFNHNCKTTLAIRAVEFRDIYDGPIFSQRATKGKDCGRHCFHQHDLEPCPAQCECAYVREIIQRLKRWPKSPTPTSVQA